MKKNIIFIIAVTAFFVFTVFLIQPLSFTVKNIAELNLNLLQFTFDTSIKTLAIFIFILIPLILFSSKKIVKILCSVIFVLGLFAIFEETFVISQIKNFDGTEYSIHRIILGTIFEVIFLVLTSFIIVKFFNSENYQKNLTIISLVFLALNGCFLIKNFYKAQMSLMSGNEFTSKKWSIDYKNYNKFSTNKNIIVILVDTYGSAVFENIIKEDAELKNSLKDFTWYKNSLSVYPRTTLALPAFFIGNYHISKYWVDITTDDSDYQEYIRNGYMSQDSLLSQLKKHDYKIEIYPWVKELFYFNPELIDNIFPYRNDDKHLSNKYHKKLVSFYFLPSFLKKPAYNYLTGVSSKYVLLSRERVYDDSDFKNYFEDDIKLDNKNKQLFKFYHLRGLHQSAIWNDTSNRLLDKKQDFVYQISKKENDNLKNFLKALKKSNIYDNSLIVIWGDHSFRSDVKLSEKYQNGDLPASNLLLYKDFNEKHDSLQIKEDVIPNITDIKKLIINSVNPNKNFNLTSGEDEQKYIEMAKKSNTDLLENGEKKYSMYPKKVLKTEELNANKSEYSSIIQHCNNFQNKKEDYTCGVGRHLIFNVYLPQSDKESDKHLVILKNINANETYKSENSLQIVKQSDNVFIRNLNIRVDYIKEGEYLIRFFGKNKKGVYTEYNLPVRKVVVGKDKSYFVMKGIE